MSSEVWAFFKQKGASGACPTRYAYCRKLRGPRPQDGGPYSSMRLWRQAVVERREWSNATGGMVLNNLALTHIQLALISKLEHFMSRWHNNCAEAGTRAAPIYVVDDDREVRASLSFMLSARKNPVRPFASGTDFLAEIEDLDPGCVILDIRMPSLNGVDILHEMRQREIEWPVVMMTGHGDVALAVETMRLGAVDFLEKPCEMEALLSSLDQAAALLDNRVLRSCRRSEARRKINVLTERQKQVLSRLIEGKSNKVTAIELNVALRTVEMHRADLMACLQAKTLADLIRLAGDAGLETGRGGRLS
ncbi:response regulator transcription factor [Allosphingosinicella sp.]|uniref:response regulator transcription factor n=1 Tax=Allosphingosinicella sp. TaxID=2823234 RepID=UPI002EDB7403